PKSLDPVANAFVAELCMLRLATNLLGELGTLVADLQFQKVIPNACFDPLPYAAGVPKGISQRFLHDAVNADLHRFGQNAREFSQAAADLGGRHALMPAASQFDNLAWGEFVQFGQDEAGREMAQLVD